MLCYVEADIEWLYLPGNKSKACQYFNAFIGTLESCSIKEKKRPLPSFLMQNDNYNKSDHKIIQRMPPSEQMVRKILPLVPSPTFY